MLIDVHAHLFEDAMDPDTRAVMARARDRGVVAAVTAGLDDRTNRWVLDQARKILGLAPAVGYHPWFLEPEPDLAALEALAVDARVVAIGEIGLDGKIDAAPAIQERWFMDQLTLARDLGLPVVVHARAAVARVAEILDDFPEVCGVLHSFPGGPDIARRLVDAGWCVSFSGSITRPRGGRGPPPPPARRPRARRAPRRARALPEHGLLLETDAPAIGLEGVAAEDVEPRHVAQVAEALAELREVDVAEIAAVTTENARRIFGAGISGSCVCDLET